MSAPMSKLRTGRRNLLAVTPALLLLTVSSLCFIPLSHQAPAGTILGDAGCSLKGSEDVRKRLSDLSELYFLFSQTKLENYQKSNAYLVNQKALDVVTEHLVRFKAGSTESAVTAAEVDFNDDNEEVKVKLECEGKDTMVEISVAARRMKGNEKNEMEKFFPKDVPTNKELLISDNDNFWECVLGFNDIFGDENELHYDNINVGNKHFFAGVFEVTYTASGIISIEPPSGDGGREYTINRIVTAVFEKHCVVVLKVPVVVYRRIKLFYSVGLGVRQKRFWKSLGYFYVEALNKAWDDPEMRDPTNPAFTDAISKKGIFDYEVNGFSVNTVLTKVEKVEDADDPNKDVIRVHARSTLIMPGFKSPVQLFHCCESLFDEDK
eukprot:GHVS01059647.1.p1 GENE.GHVS01059647.1~~GHVS01059647.1.p1  ORF type:complete len:379 (-),score=30.83 GHVS01059647.1:427-1563(-)